MPQRNEVPSLKMMSTRKVAWPDGINRKNVDAYPCAEQYCRDTIYKPFLNQNLARLKRTLGAERSKEMSNSVVNYWIRLSNYYQSTFLDFKDLDLFLNFSPPEVLDFLQEGFTLQNQTDKTKILPFVGVIPRTTPPQSVNSKSWGHIVESLTKNNVVLKVKEIFIKFNHVSDPSKDPFGKFHNLTKLVVRGTATDNILKSVGLNCYRLKYLDISHSEVTQIGIRMLFYKGSEAERDFRIAFETTLSWNLPKHFLRPLTKSLEYFDMSDVINQVCGNYKYEDAITMACPQLVATPNLFFFSPRGSVKVSCNGFQTSPTFVILRQQLVLHVRTFFCQDIFCFVRGLLACTHAVSPTVEVRVDEFGYEVSFLIFSQAFVIANCELENLTVINFSSYTKSSCAFIPLELLGHFAPNLQRLKASLKGVLSDKFQMRYLKQVAAAMVYSQETVNSLVKRCPELQYLEVREVLISPRAIDDSNIRDIFEEGACKLEVLRFLFSNKISVLYGLTYIITKCPRLRILGDLKYWSLSYGAFSKLHQQFGFHNFQIAIEYDSVIYYSNTVCEEIPH